MEESEHMKCYTPWWINFSMIRKRSKRDMVTTVGTIKPTPLPQHKSENCKEIARPTSEREHVREEMFALSTIFELIKEKAKAKERVKAKAKAKAKMEKARTKAKKAKALKVSFVTIAAIQDTDPLSAGLHQRREKDIKKEEKVTKFIANFYVTKAKAKEKAKVKAKEKERERRKANPKARLTGQERTIGLAKAIGGQAVKTLRGHLRAGHKMINTPAIIPENHRPPPGVPSQFPQPKQRH
jgi:hypothetical protein